MAKTDEKIFTKGLSKLLIGAKGLYDFGIETKLMKPEAMRLTVEARQAKAKKLVDGGMSRRGAAKLLGVSYQTVNNDVGDKKVVTFGKEVTTPKTKTKREMTKREQRQAETIRLLRIEVARLRARIAKLEAERP
jgi:transposase